MIPFSRTYKNLSTTYKDRSEFSHSLAMQPTISRCQFSCLRTWRAIRRRGRSGTLEQIRFEQWNRHLRPQIKHRT
jgi:hypothetical protein